MRTVTILTHSYLNGYTEDKTFSRPFGGGLERYMHDLCAVIHAKGWRPVVYQLSYYSGFDTVYEGTRVRGFPYDFDNVAGAFEQMAEEAEGLIIYASCIWHPIAYKPGSIGICHGINWDWPDWGEKVKSGVAYMIQLALDRLDRLVSVDSHFQTYCRSVCTFDDPEKLVLLPNAVDTAWFTGQDGTDDAGENGVLSENIGNVAGAEAGSAESAGTCLSESAERGYDSAAGAVDGDAGGRGRGSDSASFRMDAPLRLLFPRRLSYERGVVPMMLIADRLLAEFPTLTMEFAGELVEHTPVAVAFHAWRQSSPNKPRILHNTYAFQSVRDAYRAADVVVIPTIYSEGTSLSCLEAMSCGTAIVATNVGGLNDLITDGFNGRLVVPTVNALFDAVKELLEDAHLRQRYGANARRTAAAFDLKRWQRRWVTLLEEQFARLGL